MKTLPTLVFSNRGTKGPKALPVCFMSLFLEKEANPQCFQIPVLKSESGKKRQKTTLEKNSTEQIKQAMDRFTHLTRFPPLCLPACTHLSGLQVSHTTGTCPGGHTERVTGMLNALYWKCNLWKMGQLERSTQNLNTEVKVCVY